MRHIWSIICSQAIRSAETNNFSLIEVLEQITVQVPPADDDTLFGIGVRIFIVSSWWRTEIEQPEQSDARLVVKSPDNEELAKIEYQIDLMKAGRFRSVGRIDVMPYRTNGIYKFVVETYDDVRKQWDTQAVVPLEIIREFHLEEMTE